MRRLVAVLWVGLVMLAQASPEQSRSLRVLSAAPSGALESLSDANEIRMIFSEPMVPLGRMPANPGAVGDDHAGDQGQLPMVGDDGADLHARSVHAAALCNALHDHARGQRAERGGRSLGAPFTFSFTTPTVKLTSARWTQERPRGSVRRCSRSRSTSPSRRGRRGAPARAQRPHEWGDVPVLSEERAPSRHGRSRRCRASTRRSRP